MENILITFNYAKNGSLDLKIPAYMIVDEFISIMRQLYNMQGTIIQVEPQGIVLDGNLSFAEQEVEHGALLTLRT